MPVKLNPGRIKFPLLFNRNYESKAAFHTFWKQQQVKNDFIDFWSQLVNEGKTESYCRGIAPNVTVVEMVPIRFYEKYSLKTVSLLTLLMMVKVGCAQTTNTTRNANIIAHGGFIDTPEGDNELVFNYPVNAKI